MIGQTLLHYRIVQKLGAGGMGEVYRAEDTKLDRQVAIKVLPDIFSSDPEHLVRFQREAKLLASLNHSNIAAIHGLEEVASKRFLVLELVEGETLAQRIRKGPLPVDEALEICRQIADGLEAAHEKGIIHRDLKPANVKVTPEGKVKLLDFGLAKAFQESPVTIDSPDSPTVTDQMSRTGVILGTAAYMSPEQAKGKTVDKRTDIWAFGCVLYECLVGKRMFQGDTITETLASILKSEPDWTRLPVETPSTVCAVLRRCLQKDPNLRLHDIADARLEMQEEPARLPAGTLPAQRHSLGWFLSIGTAVLAIGLLIGVSITKYLQPPALTDSQPVIRSPVRLGSGLALAGLQREWDFGHPSRTAMALSSDGRFMICSAAKESPDPQGRPSLYMRRLDQLETKPIAGTEGGINPFLSPDDQWVGFWVRGRLMKVQVEGGVPRPLCGVRAPFGANWGSDGQIYFGQGASSGLSRVSANGGKPETLTNPDPSKEEYSHSLPIFLPAGKGILFTIMRDFSDLEPRVAVLDLSSRSWRVLLENAADGRYAGTGHLVFLRSGTLMAARFDLERLEVTGQPVPAIPGIMQALNFNGSSLNTASGQFSASASGSLVYAPGGIIPDPRCSLVWVDHQGKAEEITSFKSQFFAPRLSPDARKIAYLTVGMKRQIWIYDLNRGIPTKITSEGKAAWVSWTPDSRRLVFSWYKAGPNNLYWQSADGSSPMARLATGEYNQHPGSFSPDGKTLLFNERRPDSGWDIMRLRLQDRQVTAILNSRFDETHAELSPDGRWMAYASNESGAIEVYVQRYPNLGSKMKISLEGGTEPLWSRDGRQLFYRQEAQRWVVDVQAGAAFSAGKPRLLFEAEYAGTSPSRCWDVSPDGKRFLMVREEDTMPPPVTEMILVHNWFEEIKRLAPAGSN